MASISLGRLDDAEVSLVQAKTADPNLAVDVCFASLMSARRRAFEAAPATGPGLRLALLLSAAGAFAEAGMILERCLALAPQDAELWTLKGDLAIRQGRFDEAAAAAREAARLSPNDPVPAVNISGVYMAAGDRTAAEAEARAAAQKFPQCCRAWIQLADLLRDDAGAGWEAVLAAARAPDATAAALSRALWIAAERLDWDVGDSMLAPLAARLAVEPCNPFRLLVSPLDPPTLRRNAEAYSAATWPLRRALAAPAARKDKIRIGYLSPDFGPHPVGTTIVDLLRRHDRSSFEIYAYAVGSRSDSPERDAIAAAVDRFADLAELSDFQAAQRVRDDGVDILIDLAGHTRNSRLGILSFRPAPLQIHYLGYPGTVGAGFVDYLIGDPWTIPLETERFCSEAIIRLPHTYLVNSHRPPAASGWDRARFGFGPDDVVLCCFNHPNKITKPVFDAWMAVLKAAPKAVLWLRVDHPVAEDHLIAAARAGHRGRSFAFRAARRHGCASCTLRRGGPDARYRAL